MKRFLKYRAALDALLEATDWGRTNHVGAKSEIHDSLNGGASAALRQSVSESRLRRFGVFFTGDKLGRHTVESMVRSKQLWNTPVCDPTCGSGDLLLRWAENLPIHRDLRDTIDQWSLLLHGIDLHPEFLAVAKRRLVILAISKGAKLKGLRRLDIDSLFPNLAIGNVISDTPEIPDGSLLMNPPFTFSRAPKKCSWSSGLVSNAAVATAKCLAALKTGNRFAAILPDVLRSGRRYEKWRQLIGTMLSDTTIELIGKFDPHTDVDVFTLTGTKTTRGAPIDWRLGQPVPGATLGSICKIRVGAVVPHRDEQRGAWRPYLTVHDLPPWGEISATDYHRRHWSKPIQPPFVAVRRTSSPSDTDRAIGTVVRGRRSVVLENHLIVLKPEERSVRSCERILEILRDRRTREWLDKRIRCRHLTVGVIRDIPVWPRQ